MIKVIFPTDDYINSHRPTYFQYLLSGFKNLKNIQVFQDINLNKKSFNTHTKKIYAIDIYLDNKKMRVWYDWSDFQRFVYPELIQENDLYFKVECTQGYIERFNIYPIGQGVTEVDKFTKNLNKLRELNNYEHDITGIFRATSPKPNIKSIRIKCCEILDSIPCKKMLILKECQHRPLPPEKFNHINYYNYLQFLQITKKSKINLLMPGMGELTWRVSETFGMGCCGVMPKITTVLPGKPQNCWIEVKRDLSDLKEKVVYYLNHEEERKQIEKNALNYYESWLSPKAQALNILNTTKENLK